MDKGMFQGQYVKANRVIYTPSTFSRTALIYLQEVGELQAMRAHTSFREGLLSYLFFIVRKGSGTLTYHNREYSLRAGDCVFIDCRHPYSHTSSDEDLWTLQWIHFHSSMMDVFYDKYAERGGQTVFHPDNIDHYSLLLHEILEIAGAEDYIRDMKINEKIASLLTLIMSESWHPDNCILDHSKRHTLQHIKLYLEEHYSEHITLDQLSELFYINKYYLTRIFKEQFGSTIVSYLNYIRVTHAKQLLRFSDMTVEEVGRSVGIDEPGYFNRVFKKVEHMSPGEYKKLW